MILSRDHYDHLDQDAISKLAPRVEVFVTPLGVGDRLIAWGVDPAKVRQLDWWQHTTVHGVQLTAAPEMGERWSMTEPEAGRAWWKEATTSPSR